MLWRSACVVGAALWLAGCGFTPLYSTKVAQNSEAVSRMAEISIAPIPGHNGQILHNELETLLNPLSTSTPQHYELVVTPEKNLLPVGIERDRRITRYNIVIRAPYTLKEIATGRVLDKGKVKVVGSYDSVDSDFATFVAESDTTERALKDAARELKMRMTVALLKEERLVHENSSSKD